MKIEGLKPLIKKKINNQKNPNFKAIEKSFSSKEYDLKTLQG